MEIYIYAFFVGLIIGSFLNMLIYRLPIGISLISLKRSICPHCNYKISWHENVPVLSFLLLKGRCSSCNNKISIIYPVVEIITGLVTMLLLNKHQVNIEFGVLVASLFYVLIVLSFIDLKYKSVPDYLLIVAIILAFITFRDASGIRWHLGEHGKIINDLIKELPDDKEYKYPVLGEKFGHKNIEILAGIITGLILTFLIIYFLN